MTSTVEQDLNRILQGLTIEERTKLKGSTVLLTGCAGFLGFYLVQFFTYFQRELDIKQIVGLDNFKVGYPKWLKDIRDDGKNHIT